MKKLAIIGGGAAGIMAAVITASKGVSVDLFEQNSGIGKKILASGNGRCNIINTHYNNNDFSSLDADFSRNALEHFNFEAFEAFALTLGLFLDKKEDGRCYPLSNEAKSVVLAFDTRLKALDVNLFTESKVVKLEKDALKFRVSTQEKQYEDYDALLITTGSQAAPQLGGNEDGYNFATAFGHSINLTYPALVQLHIDSKIHHKMAGVRKDALVHLYVNNTKELSQTGDILFTKYGISGLTILDISERASYALTYYNEVKISVNLFPELDKAQLASRINKLVSSLVDYPILTLLSGMMAYKIAVTLLEFLDINPQTKAGALNSKELKKIIHTLQDWRFNISDTHGFKHAEVSGGGINCSEIIASTMESKLIPGLYFAGEVLDVVGRRGGFNFAWAWASAYAASQTIVKA